MKTYCDLCHHMVPYKIVEDKIKRFIKGREYTFTGQKAICLECGNKVGVNSVLDYNAKELEKVFRLENNLVSKEEINEILENYDIGRKPLSKLLGWGEHTISRYLNGDIPNKKYSDTLKEILEDPNKFYGYLINNKGNITEVAYNKSMKRLIEKEYIEIGIGSKIECVANYILTKTSDTTNLSIQKLLYYINGFGKAILGRFIFEDNCEAWVYGPVYPNIYSKYKKNNCNVIKGRNNLLNCLDVDEEKLIDAIISNFGVYSGEVLIDMTHEEDPWKKARVGLGDRERSNRVINENDMKDYFTKVIKDYKISSVNEIGKYSDDLFKKVRKTV